MKIKTWSPEMSEKDTTELAYWERNVLALYFANGWYNDDVPHVQDFMKPRFTGWRRVLSLSGGAVTFHIPDDFDIGALKKIKPNWDGHTTEEKWRRILDHCGVK